MVNEHIWLVVCAAGKWQSRASGRDKEVEKSLEFRTRTNGTAHSLF